MIKGKELKELRLKKSLTLKDVAKHLGVAEQTINKYEMEIVRNIPSDKIEKLADLYGVSPGLIMGWLDSDVQEALKGVSKEKQTIDKFNELAKCLSDDEINNVFNYMQFLIDQKG